MISHFVDNFEQNFAHYFSNEMKTEQIYFLHHENQLVFLFN